jgi:hypothetical protein
VHFDNQHFWQHTVTHFFSDNHSALDDSDIQILKTYICFIHASDPHSTHFNYRFKVLTVHDSRNSKQTETQRKAWNLTLVLLLQIHGISHQHRMHEEHPIQVTQCLKIILVVGLGERVAPTDIEEGMHVGCTSRNRQDALRTSGGPVANHTGQLHPRHRLRAHTEIRPGSARVVHELFEMARSKKFYDGAGGNNEVQRTMLELINQHQGSHGYQQT